MRRPIPGYREDDLRHIVNRDYPAEARAQVHDILSSYGNERWRHESLRVHMACLKLANGDMAGLRRYVRDACAPTTAMSSPGLNTRPICHQINAENCRAFTTLNTR
jgi:hypothetical protein